ncbi:MAG TPA: PDZ domain-containing protein [Chthonomonas sp.]|uniref:PDZ domain-containing protein n=1 Tax=Chthonomonas sp. TaxID=2282153 RepID=UPI002B4B7F3A|nr:PDZ domain-containing protein [Chthonomonas sp.]HLH81061.1 PDZ domain-containing protein [Chthonomonas sp.]
MKRYLIGFILGGLLLGYGSAYSDARPVRRGTSAPVVRHKVELIDTLHREIAFARARVYPALVNILVVYRYYDSGRAQRDLAGGSGVIISPDGYVITNYHVAGHTTYIECTLTDGERIEAKDIYDDPLTDISILKLNLNQRANPKAPLHYAVLGNSDDLHVGDFVLAMGNPLMLSSSMTLGIVSNTQRVFTDFTGNRIEQVELDSGQQTGLLTRWIQHDALILPGNSGGPLVNMQGEVVGINELGGNGVGFAIPSNLVRRVFEQVLTHGKVVRGYLGFEPLPVDKLGRKTGTLVAAVIPKSPAAEAGLKPGDVLLSINGMPTNIRFLEQVPLLYQQVTAIKPGTRVSLQVLRQGKVLTLHTVVAPMQPYLGHESEVADLGLTVRSITPMMALLNHLPDTNGLMVTGIRPGYPADNSQPKLAVGDVIRAVDGKPTPNLAALEQVVKADKQQGRLVVAYLRQNQSCLSVLRMEKPETSNNDFELPHAWLGVRTEVLTPEIAEVLHVPGTQGFLITEVFPGTNASQAGLRVGDIITSLNGQSLEASRPQDEEMLTHAIENLDVGSRATLGILRGGKPLEIEVTLQASPSSASEVASYQEKTFEFTVRDLTLFDRIERHLPLDQKGVIVTDTTEGGWANIAGLNVDDIILSVNGQPIGDVSSFKRVMSEVVSRKPKVVTLFVHRGALTYFVFIQPDWAHLN